MSDARIPAETNSSATQTIRESEAAHFGGLAKDWWDPKGSSAMLHKLNPVRLRFIREAIDLHWGGDVESRKPLAGRKALDVGCGAGLLCEPLARLGAEVTGVDAAPENVAAARAHAAGSGLRINYHAGELSSLPEGKFDLVSCLEVIEHVADKQALIDQLAVRLAPGGLLIMSAPNRTAKSRLLLADGAEMLGLIPKGTHDWNDFITPEELVPLLDNAGIAVNSLQGINYSPLTGLELSPDTSLNYILSASA